MVYYHGYSMYFTYVKRISLSKTASAFYKMIFITYKLLQKPLNYYLKYFITIPWCDGLMKCK